MPIGISANFRGNMSANYAYGTQGAEVEVDEDTGEVTILKLAAVHDVGVETGDGTPIHYMVQEYLQGETLRETITRGPLPFDRARALAGPPAPYPRHAVLARPRPRTPTRRGGAPPRARRPRPPRAGSGG